MHAAPSSPSPSAQSRLARQWDLLHDPQHPLLEQTWPQTRTLTGADALRLWQPDVYDQLNLRQAMLRELGLVPIVAVAGLLNSGKSSVVASFLSEAGRARVLRGLSGAQGSQRFTLWVPADWRQQSFFESLKELLSRLFLRPLEQLDPDPARAHAQQNDLSRLDYPLLAPDPQLDTLGLALLDCPDVQRSRELGDGIRHRRLDLVSRAAEICAALLIVTPRSQLEIQELSAILDRMPDAARIFAVNLIRDESPARALHDIRSVLDAGPEVPVYGAYDFLMSDFPDRTPEWDRTRSLSRDERVAESRPCFFLLESAKAAPNGKAAPPEASLLRLADSLAPEQLRRRRIEELEGEWDGSFHGAVEGLRSQLRTLAGQVDDASSRLVDECRHLVRREGSLHLRMSPEIVASMEASLTRTASIYYRIFLIPSRRLLQACNRLASVGRNVAGKSIRRLRDQSETLRRRLGSHAKIPAIGTIGPEEVSRMFSLWSGASGDYRPPEDWGQEAETLLRRYLAEEKTNLTDAEWDAITGPLWDQIPTRARIQILTSIFLLLGGLALAFFDGGVSLITIKTLDLLGGIGVLSSLGVNLRGVADFQKALEEKLGARQLANFCAIAADTAGLPRCPNPGLPPPTVSEQLNPRSYGIQERRWATYSWNDDASRRLLRDDP